jgi:hypothetical protein
MPNYAEEISNKINGLKMAHLTGESSNQLFDTLAQWNKILQDNKRDNNPSPGP